MFAFEFRARLFTVFVAILHLLSWRIAAQSLRPRSRGLEHFRAVGTAALPQEEPHALLLAEEVGEESADDDGHGDVVFLMTLGSKLRARTAMGDFNSGGDVAVEATIADTVIDDDDGRLENVAALATVTRWEALLASGMKKSEIATSADVSSIESWELDAGGASAPLQMLQAEQLLDQACDEVFRMASPSQNKTMSERALRIYKHALWLAENNHAKAAVWRFRKAASVALECGRVLLASSSLARLGYFLVLWFRDDEAREVLLEAARIDTKPTGGGMAGYLYGVLERRQAGSDVKRLREADELIMSAGEQASSELEASRSGMVNEIKYWREAELSPVNCFQTFDAATALVCLCGHAGAAFAHLTAAWWGDYSGVCATCASVPN
eukprot:TRINITY_DN4844_c0_g1_i2.p1 TRINITY_DN4844_c0_g1~~TRINITY_DN4844_c0_g1_i2.p1  ORF type:complete len:383 (+),score=80.05 TRINITY_DN4844_c0_g1_i2:73-1221(+)